MARWILRLNAFTFDIKYRKGTSNVVPDYLSRIGAASAITIDLSSNNIDLWYDKLRKNVGENENKYPDFRVVKGLLYKNYLVSDESGARSHRWKQVVPNAWRQDIIRRFHDLPTAAHLGYDRTLHKIQLNYYWPKMAMDIRKFVRACNICKASKAPAAVLTPAMGAPKPAKLPWELISIDWISLLVRSRNGSTVLLVIVAWITKFVIVEPFRLPE